MGQAETRDLPSPYGDVPDLQPYIRESPAGDRITRLITGLRTGTNALEVERGRWAEVPRDERVCTRCVRGGVEDERHFLLRCPYYRLERADLASQLDEVYGITWEDLTETQRLHIVLLGNGMPRALLEDYHRRGGGSAVHAWCGDSCFGRTRVVNLPWRVQ